MAGKEERPKLENFGVQETVDMGMGDAKLVNDLLAPETLTSEETDITDINEQEEEAKPVKSSPKREEQKEEEGETTEEEEIPDGQELISGFLESSDEEEEEIVSEEAAAPPKEEEEEVSTEESSAESEETSEEDGDDEEESSQEDESPTPSQFAALANDLEKLGVFSKNEDEEDIEINSPEEFLQRFKEEGKKQAMGYLDNFIAQFGDDYKNAFQAIYVNGVSPKEYFGVYNNIVNFSELDMSKEDNQVAVMKQALSDQGFEPEDINAEIERLKNYGDLEDASGRHHKVLVKKEATKLKQKEAEAQELLKQKAAIKNQYINNVQNILQDKLNSKEFDGLPMNTETANELQDFLLVDKWKTASGETLTDFDRTILELKRPENHEKKVKVALLMKMLEKDPTLSTIQRSAITKKSDQLFTEVARQAKKTKTGSVKKQDNSKGGQQMSSWFKGL